MAKIKCRHATEQDLMLYFNWANDKVVRNNAISKGTIPLESHKKWFANQLQRPLTRMYIFERDNKPFGQVRFDIENHSAIIDFSIDENYRGKGLGSKMLSIALETFRKDDRGSFIKIEGLVKSSNIPSAKVFQKLKFEFNRQEIINGEQYKVFVLEDLTKT